MLLKVKVFQCCGAERSARNVASTKQTQESQAHAAVWCAQAQCGHACLGCRNSGDAASMPPSNYSSDGPDGDGAASFSFLAGSPGGCGGSGSGGGSDRGEDDC